MSNTSGQPSERPVLFRVRRLFQAASLIFFLWLLWILASPLGQSHPTDLSSASLLPPDLFLRLDPLVATAVTITVREWLPALLPGLLVILSALILGRVFCGWLCPMGTTLDLFHLGRKRKPKAAMLSPLPAPGWRRGKYLILTLLLGSALFGLSWIFWASPISLITRFYVLVIHPLLTVAGEQAFVLGRPLLESTSLAYVQVEARRYETVYFVLGLFLALFLLERLKPRFWCRYLCPAGALLGLASVRPFWRRRVDACIQCGRCQRRCPTRAIAPDGTSTMHTECIACQACIPACPVGGVRFGLAASSAAGRSKGAMGCTTSTDASLPEWSAPDEDREQSGSATPLVALPSRRAFLAAAGLGGVLAGVGYISAASLMPGTARGTIRQERCIRPPGSRPEPDFLRRCLRCGACMKACPTNGLQPTWLAAGVEGMFSPVLASRVGPCEPECAACGRVCPTGAILPLPLEEKQQAKIGTAVVKPGLCLAWAEGKSCVVCQEVCPYGAIGLEQKDGASVPVPMVRAERCFGCGYCERHCPVFIPAITVLPLNSLRLEEAHYREAAKTAGLDIRPVSDHSRSPVEPDELPEGSLPPGFTD